jgi:VanZ family protein
MKAIAVNRYSRLSVLLLLAYLPLLVFMFHVPIEQRPSTGAISPDKTVHFVAYGLFGFLAAWVAWPWGDESVRRTRVWLAKRAALVFAALTLYGALDELTQPWTGRACELNDLQADMIGAAIGIGVFTVLAVQPRLMRFAQW